MSYSSQFFIASEKLRVQEATQANFPTFVIRIFNLIGGRGFFISSFYEMDCLQMKVLSTCDIT